MLTLWAGRLVQLQGLDSGTYRKLASQEREQTIVLPALRGSITGANGQVLAMTVETYTVAADPPLIGGPARQQQVADTLATPLGMTSAAILNLFQHPTSPQYVVLAKGVSAQASAQITNLDLPGITMISTPARSYPQGNIAANIIGFTGINAQECWSAGPGSRKSSTPCWPASMAVSRYRSATASRSRSRAAATSRW